MKQLKKYESAKKFFKKKNFIVEDKKLKAVLASIEEGLPILAVGPTGSGKTQFFELLSEFLGGVYNYQSLNGSITMHDLTEERIIGKNGKFEEKDMILATWLRSAKKGISFLQLDEINAAKPETLLSLHPIMDVKGELKLPYSEEILKVNKNSVLVMSCNEGEEYLGINAMNVAFQNRYIKIHFEYIQGRELVNLLVAKTKVSEENATQVVNTWEKYMTSKNYDQIVIGIRVLERWCNLSHYLGLKEAGEFAFAGIIARDQEELKEIVEGDFFVNLSSGVEK